MRKEQFNLTDLGPAKWHLGVQLARIGKDYVIDQSRYVSRFKKSVEGQSNMKERKRPLPADFVPTKKDLTNKCQVSKVTVSFFKILHPI